jgi:hypothetical protein
MHGGKSLLSEAAVGDKRVANKSSVKISGSRKFFACIMRE